MNVELLLKVKKHILQKPSRLRMSNWIIRKEDVDVVRVSKGYFINLDQSWGEPAKQRVPDCGTVACIAGWAQLLSGAESRSTAIAQLDLDNTRLFYVSNWPDKFCDAYLYTKTARDRAKIVGQVIDDFIKTNGWL